MIGSRKRKMGSRVRFRLWEAAFCSDIVSNYQKRPRPTSTHIFACAFGLRCAVRVIVGGLALASLGRYHRVVGVGCDG